MSQCSTKIVSKDWYLAVRNIIVPTLLDLAAKHIFLNGGTHDQHIYDIYRYGTMCQGALLPQPSSTDMDDVTYYHMFSTIINLSYTSRLFALDIFKIIRDGDGAKHTLMDMSWPLFEAKTYYQTRMWLYDDIYRDQMCVTRKYLTETMVYLVPGTLLVHLASVTLQMFQSFMAYRCRVSPAHVDCTNLIYNTNMMASSNNDRMLSLKVFRLSIEYINQTYHEPYAAEVKICALKGVLRGAIACDNPAIASNALMVLTVPRGCDCVSLPDKLFTVQWALDYMKRKQFNIIYQFHKHGALLMSMWFARILYTLHCDARADVTMTPQMIIDAWIHTAGSDTAWSGYHVTCLAKTIVRHMTSYQYHDARYAELAAVVRLIALNDRHVCTMIITLAKNSEICALPVDTFLDIVGRERIRTNTTCQLMVMQQPHNKKLLTFVDSITTFYTRYDLCCIPHYGAWYITFVLYPIVAKCITLYHDLPLDVLHLCDDHTLLFADETRQQYHQSIIDLFFIPSDHEVQSVIHISVFHRLRATSLSVTRHAFQLDELFHFREHPRATCDLLYRLKDHYRAMRDSCDGRSDKQWMQMDYTAVMNCIESIVHDYETTMNMDVS